MFIRSGLTLVYRAVRHRPAQREPDGAGAKEGYNTAVRDRDNKTATTGWMSVR